MDKKQLRALVEQGYTVGQRLLAMNMDVGVLRTNATLRKDEWKAMDTAIVEEAQQRLVAAGDILSAGLRFSLTNGLGTTILESENVSDMNDAAIDMAGTSRSDNDAVNYEVVGLPLPIIHKQYMIPIRKLNASRTRGESLDTTQARLAARKVAEALESLVLVGTGGVTYGGYTVYGYTNFPNRNTVDLAQNWDASGKTGAEIIADVVAMKQASIDDRHYGPWVMYIPTAYETVLDEDYNATRGNTIRQRIMEISGISRIQVADRLTANNVLLVQMTPDVVRMVEGLPMTNVEWQEQGGMVFNFKVMTISVPQLRADQQGRCGIIHLRAAP